MADDDKDEPPLSIEDLIDSGAEDEEAMIALLKATSAGGLGRSGPAAAGRKDAKVQAIVRDIAESNRVLVGLVTVGAPEARTSITLPPEDALRMAEKIFLSALKLPQPPEPDTLRAFLGSMVKAVQGIPGTNATTAKPKAAKPKAAKPKAAKPKAAKPKAAKPKAAKPKTKKLKSGKSKTGKS